MQARFCARVWDQLHHLGQIIVFSKNYSLLIVSCYCLKFQNYVQKFRECTSFLEQKLNSRSFFFPKIGLCHLYVNIMTKYYARLQKKNELSEQIPRKIVQWFSGIIQPDRHTNDNKLNTMKLFGLLKTHKMTVFFNALKFFVWYWLLRSQN